MVLFRLHKVHDVHYKEIQLLFKNANHQHTIAAKKDHDSMLPLLS